MGMDAESEFVLHRTVMRTAMASMLAIVGAYARHVTGVLTPPRDDGSDTLHAMDVGMPTVYGRLPPLPTRPTPKSRRFRRRRR
jgi:hypothetical protein